MVKTIADVGDIVEYTGYSINHNCDNPDMYLDRGQFYRVKRVIYGRMFYYELEGFSNLMFSPLSFNIAKVTLSD